MDSLTMIAPDAYTTAALRRGGYFEGAAACAPPVRAAAWLSTPLK